jgi:hypothetical protein
MAYTAGSVIITLNGAVLEVPSEVTASSGSSVVLGTAASAGDELNVYAFATFDIANVYTKAEADAGFLPKANPSYTGTLTGGTGVVNLGSGQFYKDANGNVGIGTSSPGGKLDVTGASTTNNDARSLIFATDTTAFAAGVGGGISFRAKYNTAGSYFEAGNIKGIKENATDGNFGGALVFTTHTNGGSPSERMRIDSNGNLLVGKTTTALGTVGYRVEGSSGRFVSSLSTGSFNQITHTSGGGTEFAIEFLRSTTTVGSITTTASATAYNTSSDYRLKENIAPMAGALAVVSALKPVTYNWKVDGSVGQGFIAHELQAVVPDCVTGEKDAVNEDGSIKAQGIDTSFLVATLTAAIQEQQAMIETLTTRLTALENK